MADLRASEAQRLILDSITRRAVESVTLERSLFRVLVEDIRAIRYLPPYDVSAMDGFAVRSADLARVPVSLQVIEDIKAGDRPMRVVEAGQCARIMTGAPLPAGADAVIRVEDTQALAADSVQIGVAVGAGNDVRAQGEGMRTGDLLLAAGTEITPGVIGVLATTKAAQFAVVRRPSVAILSTGDELEALNDALDPHKIPDSNAYALMAQVQALGIEPVLLGIARDDPAELERYLRRGLQYDVLLVSGGSSVGVHDYVRPTLEGLGVRMKFWRVAIRPGHPLAFGVSETSAVFGLPGNPVSSMVCFEEFVLPALRHMMGLSRVYRRTLTARLAHPVEASRGRTAFVRVQLAADSAGYVASSTGTQSSGVLLSMARADALLVVPADSPGFAAGDEVIVQLLDGTVFQDTNGFKESA